MHSPLKNKPDHNDKKASSNEGSNEQDPNVGRLINYFDTEEPTDPHPAPGIIREATGNNKYTIDYTTSDLFIHSAEGVGFPPQEGEPPARYIVLRSEDPIEL